MHPLKGITVVTLEHAIAVPFCTRDQISTVCEAQMPRGYLG